MQLVLDMPDRSGISGAQTSEQSACSLLRGEHRARLIHCAEAIVERLSDLLRRLTSYPLLSRAAPDASKSATSAGSDSALRPRPTNLLGDGVELLGAARQQPNTRPGIGEPERELAADSASGTRHESDPAV